MKKILFLLFICSTIIPLVLEAQTDSAAMKEITAFRNELNSFYADSASSPLLAVDKMAFKGLDFYPVNTDYRIHAKFVRTPAEKPFKMRTTTDRLPDYVKYGEVNFNLMGKKFKLNIYQNLQLMKKAGYENYLFLPFTDLTNGDETYGGGRYIDLRIPEGETIIIDFNQCYNPYCAYNHRYSCPIPPKENDMDVKVKAGVKAFRSVTEH
jgi:uncharacterized protein (DUF1684 family)